MSLQTSPTLWPTSAANGFTNIAQVLANKCYPKQHFWLGGRPTASHITGPFIDDRLFSAGLLASLGPGRLVRRSRRAWCQLWAETRSLPSPQSTRLTITVQCFRPGLGGSRAPSVEAQQMHCFPKGFLTFRHKSFGVHPEASQKMFCLLPLELQKGVCISRWKNKVSATRSSAVRDRQTRSQNPESLHRESLYRDSLYETVFLYRYKKHLTV